MLLRLTGSSSSPREKNWPVLDVPWDARLSMSDELVPFSFSSFSSPAVRVLRLSCEVWEVRDSLDPEPSLLKAE